MANWPRVARERPCVSIVTVVLASFAVLLAVALWGPVVGASVAVPVTLTCFALYAWHRRVSERHARYAADPFTFAEWNVRIRAKDLARELIDTQRREKIAVAQ